MLLIRNAYIKPITGPDIPNGCLLAEDGRITAVAAHIDAPEGCTVIDAGGRLLTPGCVEAHCHIGLDNQCMRWEGMDYNEIVDPLTPQLRAIDSINPQDEAFPNAIRGGVTTACTGPGSANVVGGTFTVLKLAGKRVDNMLLRHVRHRKAGRKARRPDDSARARRDEVRLRRESQGLLWPGPEEKPHDPHGRGGAAAGAAVQDPALPGR